MKKTLHIIGIVVGIAAIAFVMSACNSSPKKDEGFVLAAVDTTGLAAFQYWKTQNETKDPSMYYMQASQPAPAKPKAAVTRKVTPTPSQTSTQETKKKGWSKAAKGTAIGAGAGAVAGAIINKKNRVLGGVIGSVIGGGIGYGIGRGMDKKDGRVK